MVHASKIRSIFGLDPRSLTVNVAGHHFWEFVFQSASKVTKRTIENTRELLEQAREAHRLLVNRERRTNEYKQIRLRNEVIS